MATPSQTQIQELHQSLIINSDRKSEAEELSEENESSSELTANAGYLECILKTFSTGAVLIDLIFVVFLIKAINGAIDTTLDDSGITNAIFSAILKFVGGAFAIMSTACDAVIASPAEDSRDIIESRDTELDEKVAQSKKCERYTYYAFKWFNQILATIPNCIGAAADALGFAYLLDNAIYRWSTAIPTTILGMFFYVLITRAKINRHSYEFIHRLLNCQESMIVEALKSLAKTLEAIAQIVFNSAYRGASIGYIMHELLIMLFNRDENDPGNIIIISSAAILAIHNSLVSRTLNVHDEFFNKKFETIPKETLDKTKVSKIELTLDAIMVSLRAFPILFLLLRHGTPYRYINYLYGGASFILTASHGFYVRYKARLYQTALQDIQDERLLQGNLNLTDSTQMFNHIVQKLETNAIRRTVTIFNAMGRTARSGAFLWFLLTLNKSLGFNLEFPDVFCLYLLGGIETFRNEASFYQKAVERNLATYEAKFLIERKKAPQARFCSVIGAAFWNSSRSYKP
ncbi:MAG: hypothetical protein M1561_00750, partial [Gammaproteobacteria bacterium]|nr:hypothetical protein [Gammaproteobacteria bacterium]